MSDAMRGDVTDRLRGKYPIGPQLSNGQPEFGWRNEPDLLVQEVARPDSVVWAKRPPIMEEAAKEIEELRRKLQNALTAMINLWTAQRPYMANRGNEQLGEKVGEAARAMDLGNVKRHSLDRLASFIGAIVGKRLTYARLTA